MKQARMLVIHQNFPGQFRYLTPWLANLGHEVVALGEEKALRRQGTWPFEFVTYNLVSKTTSKAHHYLHAFEAALRRGQAVVRKCLELRRKGFVPDLIIGHPAWGELLFVRDAFPDARVISYMEYFYRARGGDVGFDPEYPSSFDAVAKLRVRNSQQVFALSECDAGISPTQWQRSTYPEHEQHRIRVIHEGVDSAGAKPDPNASLRLPNGLTFSAKKQVITYVSRNLEPYRGFHIFMRALPKLQRHLPEAHFVVVGGDGVSYGKSPPHPYQNYREQLLAEVGSEIQLDRVHFLGKLDYPDFLRLMQISRLHIYLTYPFVLSWSCLEAMACGAPVLGSATPPVQEVIQDGVNGYLFDFFNVDELVEKAVHAIEGDCTEVRVAARRMIETKYSTRDCSLPA